MPDNSNLEENAVSSTGELTPPGGVSGRRLAVVVLISLVLVGGSLSYVLWCYNRIDAARRVSDESWRSLAEELSGRYRRIETVLAKQVDAREIEMELGEQFHLAADRFRTTAQPVAQFEAATELEALLTGKGLVEESSAAATDAAVRDAVEQHNAARRKQRQAQESLGGKFLSVFLNFADPAEIELAK